VVFATESTLTREALYQNALETIHYYHENFEEQEYNGLMDWPAVGLSAFGEELTSEKWTGTTGKNAVSFREEEVQNSVRLSTVKNTDFQRTIIGVTAVGADPKNFGSKDLVAIVKGTMLPNGHFADSVEDRKTKRPVGNTLINAHCFGVISLYTAGELIPNRDKCLEWLIDKQHHDGGFTWDVKTYYDPEDAYLVESGIDMTAAGLMSMAILGLDRNSLPVKRGLAFLKSHQIESGGFSSWGTANPESCVWVIQALTLLGIDPMGEEWTTDEGNNPVSAMMAFQLDNGSFTHVLDEKDDLPVYDNGMSTEQGLYGMAAAYFNKSVYQIQHDKYKDKVAPTLFKDININTPYYDAIIRSVYKYDMKGYNDGTFKPQHPTVAIKFYDALVKGANLEYAEQSKDASLNITYYGDLSESQWGWASINKLLDIGLLNPEGNFQASGVITKAEAVAFVKRLLTSLNVEGDDFNSSIAQNDEPLTNAECAQLIVEMQQSF